MAIWRRKTVPACPGCGRPAAFSVHIGCGGGDDADLYVDITTGRVRCSACAHESCLEGWRHHCTSCFAVYQGGEVWEGMAAEAGRNSELSWTKVAHVRRGDPRVSFLGWSRCRGCQRNFGDNLIQQGGRFGGLCADCQDRTMKLWRRWFAKSPPRGWLECSWCGKWAWAAPVGAVSICYSCLSRMEKSRVGKEEVRRRDSLWARLFG